MFVMINGKLVSKKKAVVSVFDHGFLYGDGAYETLRVYDGRAFQVKAHLRRLANSLRGLRLQVPWSAATIERMIQKTIDANRIKETVVRLTISRGPGPYGFDPRPLKNPQIVISCFPFVPYPSWYHARGVTAALVSVRRNNPLSLPPSVKSTNCLNGILAKMEANDLGAQEALFLTVDGFLTEGTVCNVFLVKKGILKTPRLDGTFLPGVTRALVLSLARAGKIPIGETRLTARDLRSADEIFLTNTTMEVMPVARVIDNSGGRRRSIRMPAARPVTRLLMEAFNAKLRSVKF